MIRLGLIGLGYWGPNLLRNFQKIEDCRVELIADTEPARLQNLTQFRTTTEPKVVFDSDVDGVVIATSAKSHFELARAGLDSGKHLFVEKPLTTSAKEAEELCRLAQEHRKILMVGHLLLYHPAARYIKELVSSGRLGEIYYAYSTRVNLGRIRRDENVIWSLCPHDIAVLLYLFDTSPTWMACTGQVILNPGIEDLAYLTMGFPGGRLGHIHASWLDPCKIRRLVVVGSTAMVVFDDMEAQEKIRIYDRGVEPTAASTSYSESSKIRFGDILIPKISTEEPLRIECRHFVECIREEKPPMTDGRNGYEVVKLLEAAQRALKERRTITL